jgi:pimeloyl-ACP methyl ester carboxylesterase
VRDQWKASCGREPAATVCRPWIGRVKRLLVRVLVCGTECVFGPQGRSRRVGPPSPGLVRWTGGQSRPHPGRNHRGHLAGDAANHLSADAGWSTVRLFAASRRVAPRLATVGVATFVLIPGAGGSSWVWSRVTRLLTEAGHEAIAVDLPGGDETAGLARYTELVVDAIGSLAEVVLVAGSLGGFTAPLVCERVTVRELVLVNAMIPQVRQHATGGHIRGRSRPGRRRPSPVATVPSTWLPTSCTMSTPRSRPRASGICDPGRGRL